MEQLLALEMVRVTEEAAIASARAMGRGDRHGADQLATEAMRRTMDEIRASSSCAKPANPCSSSRNRM